MWLIEDDALGQIEEDAVVPGWARRSTPTYLNFRNGLALLFKNAAPGELASFLTRSPVVAMIVEGPSDNTWELGRILIGKTQVTDAQPGSIRGDFATTTNENLVHGSDSHESAQREIDLWFPSR